MPSGGEEKLQAFIDEFATNLEAAKHDLESQLLAGEKANKYIFGRQGREG